MKKSVIPVDVWDKDETHDSVGRDKRLDDVGTHGSLLVRGWLVKRVEGFWRVSYGPATTDYEC
jgi:hypothetical protein